jgi:hypothetical protein
MTLHLPAEIFFKEIEGFLIVLDIRTEAYYMFDPVGALMWKALLVTSNETEALQVIQNEYSIDRAHLTADLEEFRKRCLEQGFLQNEKKESNGRIQPSLLFVADHPRFLTLRAWWCLFRTVRSLSVNGFSRVYREYALLPIPQERTEGSNDLLTRALAAFTTAENFFLIKHAPKDCMPRSLALFRFLRSVGLRVEHCIGVRRFPFYAHAWVEHRGRVVQDKPSRQWMFSTIARISA